jgi:hypothetical protein
VKIQRNLAENRCGISWTTCTVSQECQKRYHNLIHGLYICLYMYVYIFPKSTVIHISGTNINIEIFEYLRARRERIFVYEFQRTQALHMFATIEHCTRYSCLKKKVENTASRSDIKTKCHSLNLIHRRSLYDNSH